MEETPQYKIDQGKRAFLYLLIVTVLNVSWWYVTLYFIVRISEVYSEHSNLPLTLVTVDSILFGCILVFLSVNIAIHREPVSDKIKPELLKVQIILEKEDEFYRSIKYIVFSAGAIIVSIMANISSYFLLGTPETIVILYQLWVLPALFSLIFLPFVV